jgi:hypothetical protein
MVTTMRRKSTLASPGQNKTKDSEPIQSDNEESESDKSSDSNEEAEKETSQVEISEEEIKHAIALASEAASKRFGWKKSMKPSSTSNPLSDIIPGYIAPMSLDASSLDKYKNAKPNLGITTSTKSTSITNKPTSNYKKTKPDPADIAKSKTSAGSGWFNFEATPYTAEIQQDIAVIRNRNYLNPKKFYKSSDFGKKGSQSKMVQLGTVIEGCMESVFTNRLTKKQMKSNVMEEVMGDVFASKNDYVKRKYSKMQKEKSAQASKRKSHKKVWK